MRILNETAAAVWRLIDGQRTLAQIMEAIGRQFSDMSADAERQVLDFAHDLREVGAVVERPR